MGCKSSSLARLGALLHKALPQLGPDFDRPRQAASPQLLASGWGYLVFRGIKRRLDEDHVARQVATVTRLGALRAAASLHTPSPAHRAAAAGKAGSVESHLHKSAAGALGLRRDQAHPPARRGDGGGASAWLRCEVKASRGSHGFGERKSWPTCSHLHAWCCTASQA